MSPGASRVLVVLIIALPVIALCLPRRPMTAIHDYTVCPFTVYNTTTGGVPKNVLEYRCVNENSSEKIDNSRGRCMVGHECVQGTTSFQIQMSDGTNKTQVFLSGCFCASQLKNTPTMNQKPQLDNFVNKESNSSTKTLLQFQQ